LHPEALNESNLSLLREFAQTRENSNNLSEIPRVYIISRVNIFKEFKWMKVITINHSEIDYIKDSEINTIKVVYSEKASSGKTYHIQEKWKDTKTIYIDESLKTLPKIEPKTHLSISNYLFENDLWFLDELWSLIFFGYHIYSDNSILFFKQIKELILEIPCVSNWSLPFKISDTNQIKHEPQYQSVVPNEQVKAMWSIVSNNEDNHISYKDIFQKLIQIYYHKFTHKEMISRIENMRELVFISHKCDKLGESFYENIVEKEGNVEKKALLCLSFFRSIFQQSNLVPSCYRGYLYLLPRDFMDKLPNLSKWILISKYPTNQTYIPQWKYNNQVLKENEVIRGLNNSNIVSYGDEWFTILTRLGLPETKSSSFSFTPTVFSRFIQMICKSHFCEPVILSGPTGCGKTSMVNYFGELKVPKLKIVLLRFNVMQELQSSLLRSVLKDLY